MLQRKTVLQQGITNPITEIILGSEIHIFQAFLFLLCNPPFYLTTITITFEKSDKHKTVSEGWKFRGLY